MNHTPKRMIGVQKGDILICTTQNKRLGLTAGKKYELLDARGNELKVRSDEGYYVWFLKNNFKFVGTPKHVKWKRFFRKLWRKLTGRRY